MITLFYLTINRRKLNHISHKMEVININPSTYRKVILQHGAGTDDDGYYYYQQGEGLGSFFSNILKYALPLVTRTIKGSARIAKPHLQKVGQELVAAGAKRITDQLAKPKRKRRKTRVRDRL